MKDAKAIAYELFQNLNSDEFCDPKVVAEQLRMMADESEGLENQIFEIGVSEIQKECRKNFSEFQSRR